MRSIPRGEVLKTAVASCGLRLFHEVSWRPLSSEQRRRASLVGRSVCAHERGFEHAMLSGGVVHCQVMGSEFKAPLPAHCLVAAIDKAIEGALRVLGMRRVADGQAPALGQ